MVLNFDDLENRIDNLKLNSTPNTYELNLTTSHYPSPSTITKIDQLCSVLNIPTPPNTSNTSILLDYLFQINNTLCLNLSEELNKIKIFLKRDDECDRLELEYSKLVTDYIIIDYVINNNLEDNYTRVNLIKRFEHSIIDMLLCDSRVIRYLKGENIRTNIYESENCLEKIVFIKLLENESVIVESLVEEGVDKVELLKLIYQLEIKGIVKFSKCGDNSFSIVK